MVDFGISQSVYLTENRHGTTSLDAGDRLMKSNLFRLLDMLLKDVFNRWVDGVYKVSLYLCLCACVFVTERANNSHIAVRGDRSKCEICIQYLSITKTILPLLLSQNVNFHPKCTSPSDIPRRLDKHLY